jgi:hypothetical protein
MPSRSHRLVTALAALAPLLAAAPAFAQQPVDPYDASATCPPGSSCGAPAEPPAVPPPAAAATPPPADQVVIPPNPAMAPGPSSTSVSAKAAADDLDDDEPVHQKTLHGFRLGYMYVSHFDKQTDPDDPESSLKERADMKSPHLFLIGYEVMRRLVGHSWLNIILVGNVTVGGLEQSKFYPSANALIGFEFEESFQIGVGPNLTPDPGKVAHIMFAGGWTPRVGSFHVPVHGFYIPDVDGVWRSGATVGVNW